MEYNWCHGPKCHEHRTQDRIRGVKGSKVLRTRKIAQNNWNANNVRSNFCSQGCSNEFMYAHWSEFVGLYPRTECLETPIDVQVETKFDWQDNPYKVKVIKKIDSGEQVG